MGLTRDNWVTIILGVGLLVLTVVLNITVVEQWRKAHVQYAAGGAYIHSKLAIGSLGVKNWGHSDAENVTITASLPDPIINISTDQLATPFEPSAGGIGQRFVIGTIKRVVPGETVNVYFITEPTSPVGVDRKPSIQAIKFNGGMARTGLPVLFFWGPQLLVFIVLSGVMIGGVLYLAPKQRQSWFNSLRGAIQLGVSARQEGVSAEELNTRVEKFHQGLSFWGRPRKATVIACAQAAFTEVRQEDKLKP